VRQQTATRTASTQRRSASALVVIVGAGPTGLAAANLLGIAGINTLILEQNADLSDCPKAISIDDEGLRICQTMGFADEIIKHGVLGIHAQYLSGQYLLAKVAPTSRRNGYPLISTFYQPAFEFALLRGLDRFPCVEVRFQQTVEGFVQDADKVTLTVRMPDDSSHTIDCDYLLACDGGKSPIRHALGIPMTQPKLLPRQHKRSRRETDVGQRWLVVDAINDDENSTVATFFCEPHRPAVTVPAPHHVRRWEFMLLKGERDEDLLSDHTIHALINQARASHSDRGEATRQNKPRIIRKTIYAFRSVAAQQFRQNRIFLLGDAAHLMPPFGGQGMNSGLRDAHNLCWKLQMVLQGRASTRLLETYHQERYPHVEQMILFSAILGNIVMPTTPRTARLRDWFFAIMNHLPPFREAITEMRVKPQPRYSKGFLLPAKVRENKQLVGVLLPQPYVLTQKGERVLFDDVLGDGFALIRLYEEPEQVFEPLQGKIWQQLGVRRICVLPQGAASEIAEKAKCGEYECEVVRDVDGQLGIFLRQQRGIFVLVRPDRYIAGVFGVEEITLLLKLSFFDHSPGD